MGELSSRPCKIVCGVAVYHDAAADEWTWKTANCEWTWPPFRVRDAEGAIRHIRTGATALRGAVRQSLREDDYPGSLYLMAGG